jgi:hypothetical protein
MSLVRCAGLDVLSMHVGLSLYGVWTAHGRLDSTDVPTGQVLLEADGGFSLHGTIARGGIHLDAAHVIVIGGAGGLHKEVSGSYRSAQFRDPLDAIARAAGETLSADITEDLLSLQLTFWTLGACRASRGLDDLARFAGVNWRLLPDGKLWLGEESWPSAEVPEEATIEDRFPIEKRVVLAVETPALLPGVDLVDVGRVVAVDHYIEADMVRTHAWT